jgi:hypothetical protein
MVLMGGGASIGGTSRIRREAYIRICERLGVKLPGATRRSAGDRRPYADQGDFPIGISLSAKSPIRLRFPQPSEPGAASRGAR